jgi:hypothetical protein
MVILDQENETMRRDFHRYYRMRCGGVMNIRKYILIPFIFIMLIFIYIGCDSGEPGLSQLFPGPGFQKGWSWYGFPQKISREEIAELTDSSAGLFQEYGFENSAACTYFFGRKKEKAFTVMIMKMKDSLSAFGIYTRLRGVQSRVDTIGTEAFRTDSLIRFCQGAYYIELKTDRPAEDVTEAMRGVANSLEKRIGGDSAYPGIVRLLPEEGLVPGSLQYFASGMFGMELFPGGITGEYSIGSGGNAKALIAVFQSSDQAKQGLRSYLKGARVKGGRITPLSGMSWGTAVSWPEMKEFFLLERSGPVIFGVYNVHSAWRGIELFQTLKIHLSDRN